MRAGHVGIYVYVCQDRLQVNSEGALNRVSPLLATTSTEWEQQHNGTNTALPEITQRNEFSS